MTTLVGKRIRWSDWERTIETHGVEIDRPAGSIHPRYAEIRYPIDYGFVPDTVGSDGEPLDVFVGSTTNGLVGAILTSDYRRGDLECKLIYNASPTEIYLINGFINFDRRLMEGVLLLREPMRAIWDFASEPNDA